VVVDVPRQQDGVDALLHGDADHLAQDVVELLEPRPSPDRPSDVPVARVQQPHVLQPTAGRPRITSLSFWSGRPAGNIRALEVRGTAELHETGGDAINPRFSNFDPRFFRIRPTRIVSWGIEEQARDGDGRGFHVNARSVT